MRYFIRMSFFFFWFFSQVNHFERDAKQTNVHLLSDGKLSRDWVRWEVFPTVSESSSTRNILQKFSRLDGTRKRKCFAHHADRFPLFHVRADGGTLMQCTVCGKWNVTNTHKHAIEGEQTANCSYWRDLLRSAWCEKFYFVWNLGNVNVHVQQYDKNAHTHTTHAQTHSIIVCANVPCASDLR